MTGLLTPEQMYERYCMQPCPGDCLEPGSICMQPPGHVHDHHHATYDYTGTGSHWWHRELPTKKEILRFLQKESQNGRIEVERAAELLWTYWQTFVPAAPKKRWWQRAR
jgi:hypothetical protein